MPRHDYCTLFDSKYLPRGLALYRSLERHDEDFLLRAVCLDLETRELLERLSLERLQTIGLDEVERADPGLLAVRDTRTPWEYYWTATPAICRVILDREPDIDVLTYLDADMCFTSSADPLFEELGSDSIMLVPHRSPDGETLPLGIYNVGWVSFRNDEHGRAALDWWHERCLEWCFERVEPHRFADQKYLDDWPERFNGVKVCDNVGAGVARWNERRYRLSPNGSGPVLVDGTPLIFYHHAGLRLYRRETASARLLGRTRRYVITRQLVWTTAQQLPEQDALELVWKPYLERLAEAVDELRRAGAPATLGMRPTPFREAVARLWMKAAPARAREAYRRMPLGFRSRVRRVVTAR